MNVKRMVMRIIRGRWRLFLSGLVFLLTIATLLIRGWHWSPGFLIAWDVGVVLYLFLIWRMVAYADTTFIRQSSKLQDVGRYAVPAVTMVGALVSLAAVFHQLSTGPKCTQPLDLALVAVTLLLSWVLIQTILALHYAHEFYAEHRGSAGGLEFPDGEHPNYWDFIYFSFGIGMTFQVSDVRVTSRVIRKTVTAHGFASFMFNVTLLALSFNIAASALREPWC